MRRLVLTFLLSLLLIGCGTSSPTPYATPTVVPDQGQPSFPLLGKYWVVDNGCGFTQAAIENADQTFEKLRTDGIAEIAVVCQSGVQGGGKELLWLRDWGRFIKLGNLDTDLALVYLIRPDVPPEENRISIEASTHLYWDTAMDYWGGLEEAAQYLNYGDFSGGLESLARTTNERLRNLWESHR